MHLTCIAFNSCGLGLFVQTLDSMVDGNVDLFKANGNLFYPMISENTGVAFEHVVEIMGHDFGQ